MSVSFRDAAGWITKEQKKVSKQFILGVASVLVLRSITIPPRRMVRLAVFVLAFLVLPASVRAIATLSVSTGRNPALSGDVAHISGAGFPARASLMLWLDTGNGQLDVGEPVFARPIQTDDAGLLPETDWRLDDVPAGLFVIQAGTCQFAPAVRPCVGTVGLAQAQLTIKFGISRHKFGSGTTVQVTGYGFSSNDTVDVWYDNNPHGVLSGASGSKSPTTDANGAFSADLTVSGRPGTYYIHASSSTLPIYIPVGIGTCWFQECLIDDVDTVCLLGNSPSDLTLFGVSFADCKRVDTSYTKPQCPTRTPMSACTSLNTPPGGYDLNNVGPQFMGAGVLAAATNDLGLPGTGCATMSTAIIAAELPPPIGYGNTVPDKASLITIACAPPPPPPCPPSVLACYIGTLEACVFGIGPCNHVPDKDFIVPAVLAVGGPAAPPLVQETVAQAAVAAAIACGHVNYYCDGRDITKTILESPVLQKDRVPLLFFQSPINDPPSLNPCAAVGVKENCWGGVIGWARVACTDLDPQFQRDDQGRLVLDADGDPIGICEQADKDGSGKFSKLAVPGSAGSPHNSGADFECTTGEVVGLSIGYDGDVSFNLDGPDVRRLVNYHNFQPGPGGTDPPNGIDIEIPVADRGLFFNTLVALRPGMQVHVCGRWVADMHMLWNELHPITSLSILTQLTVTASNATRTYGAANPAFTVSYSGFLNGDDAASLGGALVCTTPATTGSPVGDYPITCSGQTSDTYAITYSPGTLSITQSPLSISANEATRPYGAADPPFTTDVSGLVNGDTLNSIGVNPICSTTATPTSPVGSYPIICSGPSSTTNYAITYSPGTLTITQAALTIAAYNATRPYGSANPAFTVNASGLFNGDTLPSIGVNAACVSTATPGSPVGSYSITCSGPSSTTNYAITYQAGVLTITAAPLTITANNATKILHAPNPPFFATHSGFVNGETPASLTGTLSCTTTATTATNVGSYPITCSGQTSTNYNITYVPGTLKIVYASSGICGGDAGHQILQPVNADGTSVWKQGRTVPAKFRVCDANGVSVGTPGVVSSFMLVQIIGGTVTDVDETVDSTTVDTAFRWDPAAQQWIFNISTTSLSAGQTYVYAIALNDGSTIMFRYGLR